MSEVQRHALVRSLSSRLPAIEFDALRVIDRVVQRLELGRERHGELDLSKPRDWQRERFEERLDALVYDVCAELAAEDLARAGLREAARVEMFAGVDRSATPVSLQHVAEPMPVGDAIRRGIELAAKREAEPDGINVRVRGHVNFEHPAHNGVIDLGARVVDDEAPDPYEGRTPWPHPSEAEPDDDVGGEAG